jgi:hypothetical protein
MEDSTERGEAEEHAELEYSLDLVRDSALKNQISRIAENTNFIFELRFHLVQKPGNLPVCDNRVGFLAILRLCFFFVLGQEHDFDELPINNVTKSDSFGKMSNTSSAFNLK